MKRSLTVSVMHTGTTLAEHLLNRWSLGHEHVHNDVALERMRAADVIVYPLRDPRAAWRSWSERGASEELFRRSWRRLDALVTGVRDAASSSSPLPPILPLPVDAPDRDARLARIAEALGVEIAADWTPLGRYDGPRVRASEIDLSEVYALSVVKEIYS